MNNKINCIPSMIEFNLSRKGHRITKARKQLIEFIVNWDDDFFTISDYMKVQENLNIATFYNNIQLIVDANVIGKIKTENETKYYIKSKTNIVVHCMNCNNEELIKLEKVPTFEIEGIVQYDAFIFKANCSKC